MPNDQYIYGEGGAIIGTNPDYVNPFAGDFDGFSGTGGNTNAGGNSWLNALIGSGGSILEGGADIINAIKGNTPTYNINTPGDEKKSDSTMIILIVVAVAVLFLMGMFIFKRSK